MVIYPIILMRKMDHGSWMPLLCESPEFPLPTFIVLAKGLTGGKTEEQIIEEYKKLNDSTLELKFVSVGTIDIE